MSLIDIRNLSFTYEGGYTPVFENVSFRIDTDWKLGFVGRNGRGKTTFLNLLMDKYEYTGKIVSDVAFTYFPFTVTDKTLIAQEILSNLCSSAEEWEILRELSLLRVEADAYYRPFDSLSGGEQTKLLLAALFLGEHGFLLIDEPTNHLDAEARRTVSQYLNKKKGFILVSHDRSFLDGCVDHILSINRTDIEICSGNFSSWHENFKRRQSFELSENERLQRDISRLSAAAARTAVWADRVEASKFGKTDAGLKPDRGYVGHKSAKMMKRAKSVQARQEKAAEQKSQLLKNVETEERLKLSPLAFRTERVAAFTDVCIYYDGKAVCGPLSFTLSRGDRLALNGKNGCGKSSLLKIIAGEKISHGGLVYLPSGLIVSYVPQTAAGLSGSLSQFAAEHGIDESLFKAILNKMDFDKRLFDTDVSDYSEGQKKKVLIAKSLCESAHIYVWDEPLNFIDVYSRMQIERLICEFNPTMIFVEHDKTFRDSVATATFDF